MADLCLTTFGLKVLHIDNRPHTTEAGRADGLQPRTLEVRLIIRLYRSETIRADQELTTNRYYETSEVSFTKKEKLPSRNE